MSFRGFRPKPDDLKQIEDALSHITIEGERYPAHLKKLAGR